MNKRVMMLVGAVVAGVVVVAALWRRPPAPPAAVPIATTQTVAPPTTAPHATSNPRPPDYIDAVRSANPSVPATQPLGYPVDLNDAAHVVLHDPVYIDPLGHLWIARPDARPTNEALRTPVDPPEHVIRDVPVFAHWWVNDNGEWAAAVVTRGGRSAGPCEVVTVRGREPLPVDRPFQWQRAFSWDGKIVVPTDIGVSVIEVQPHVRESYHDLPGVSPGGTAPWAALDTRGVIAWAPWDNGRAGSHGVSRFIDGNWSDLTTDPWAAKIIQLVPLLDGSVLQLAAGDENQVSLAIVPLESAGIDRHHVEEQVALLSDPDQEKRDAAYKELSRYGTGLWPMLEQMAEDQPAEGRMAIRALLQGKITPALGGMAIMENRLDVVSRQNDGVVLFYAPVGVRIPHADRDPETVSPAWITLRSGGRVDRPLPPPLIADQKPETSRLRAAREDWLICDGAGVRRFIGNAFVPLARADESDYTQLLGVDRRGRWVLQRPAGAPTTMATSAPATGPVVASTESLIVDPTILDPTPRLPVWTMVIRSGGVGWDAADYPVIKRGGAWALKADGWEPLPENAKMITELPPMPSAEDVVLQATTAPSPQLATTTMTTRPTTNALAIDLKSLGPPLRVTSDGTRYYDGRTSLVVVDPTKQVVRWLLPAAAQGRMDPTLIRTADGRLFLFNEPGRVLRIKPTPGAVEPFALEATFTKDIPNTEHPTRIWLDPLGRICEAYNGNTLAVMFPAGHIPPEISQMMMDNP